MAEEQLTTEPFEGYSAAIGGLQERLVGLPGSPSAMPGGMPLGMPSNITPNMLMQAFAAPSPVQEEKKRPDPPAWMHFIPGFSKGVAQAKQTLREDERLKLEKQRLAGQQALEKLKRLELMQKMEERQNAARFAQMYGGLKRHQDVLDPESVREMEGNIAQSLALAGDVEGVTKFEESRRADRAERAMAADQARLDAGELGMAPAAPAAAPGVAPAPSASPAAGPVTAPRAASSPQRGDAGLYARMIREESVAQGLSPEATEYAVAIATQESSLNPGAVGDAGKAIGLFGLHAPAAADVGLTPEERADVRKNIRGGVAYFKLKLKQAGGDIDKALRLYNGGGDPNYVQNVRRHLPQGASPGMSQMVAGPGAPAPTQTPAQLEAPSVQQELTRLRNYEALLQRTINQNSRYTDKASQARLALWKDEREQVQEKIKRLEERQTTAQKRQWELEDYEKKERIKAGIEAPGVAEKRQLDIAKMQREAAEAPEMAKTRALQRQKLEPDIEKDKREQGGVLLPEQRMKAELAILGDVRQEPVHKQFMEVRNGFQNIQAGKELDNAQGDLAIINGYAKILDPGSTVREGEFATVGGSQGFFERMGIKFETFMHGERLAPAVRERFLKAGEALAEKKATSASKDLRSKYEPIAKRAGLNFEELVPLDMGIATTKQVPAADTSKKSVNEMTLEELRQEEQRLKGQGK